MIVFASTSAGTHTSTNQDSLLAELLHNKRLGRMVFAVVADGMGGMEKGEVASSTVVNHFTAWLRQADFTDLEPRWLWQEWGGVVAQIHQTLLEYSAQNGVSLGSTATVLLLAAGRYHIMNLGDTRCYEITDRIKQITQDHSLIAQEVRRGHLTEAAARVDSRQNVLLQCLGSGSVIQPDFFSSEAPRDAKYLVCTDGMRHFVSDQEIWQVLAPGLASPAQVQQLIQLNRLRGETDDISAVLVQNSPQGGTSQLKETVSFRGGSTL
jgi:serine/threonine protein phosphatase PrpC